MQRNEIGGVGVHHVSRYEDFFEKAFEQVWQYIQTVSVHQKPLTRFRAIADSLPGNEQIPGGTETKKYGETRYGSRVTISECMIKTKRIYEKLILDQEYMSWMDRQTTKTKDKVRMWTCNVISVLNSNMDIHEYILCVTSPSLCLSNVNTDTQGHRYHEVHTCRSVLLW